MLADMYESLLARVDDDLDVNISLDKRKDHGWSPYFGFALEEDWKDKPGCNACPVQDPAYNALRGEIVRVMVLMTRLSQRRFLMTTLSGFLYFWIVIIWLKTRGDGFMYFGILQPRRRSRPKARVPAAPIVIGTGVLDIYTE